MDFGSNTKEKALMEQTNAPRTQRLLCGLKELCRGNNYQFTYTIGEKCLNYRVDVHWLKKLSALSQLTIDDISSRFSKYTVLGEEQLGKRSLEIVFSDDGELVFKIVSLLDVKKLQKILDDYIIYLRNNPRSLIAPILRVFTIKTADLVVNDYFVLMESVRPPVQHTAYDVKGLLQGRAIDKSILSMTFGKDNELVNSEKIKLLRKAEMLTIWDRLQKDVSFLCKNNIMDYSLMICFYDQQNREMKGQHKLTNGTYCSIGIIDYLQEYNTLKRMAGAFKGLFKNAEISTTDCQVYCKRMLQFVEKYMKD